MKKTVSVLTLIIAVAISSFGQKRIRQIEQKQNPDYRIDAGCGCNDAVQNYELLITSSNCVGQYCVGWCAYQLIGSIIQYTTSCQILGANSDVDKTSKILKSEMDGGQYVNETISSLSLGNTYLSNVEDTNEEIVSVDLNFEGEGLIIYSYVLQDLLGHPIRKVKGASTLKNSKLDIIEASNLDSGIYNLVVSANGNTFSRNIVKQ